jgi:hypothetical protein
MKLRFHWDSLRRRDHILAHDVRAVDLGRRPAVVTHVGSRGLRRDPAARSIVGADADWLVPPGRFAAHPEPLTGETDRWREAA